ncbi:MAG: hypothetical protein EXS51_04015, partial [Candidatus Taylorbacteria bacterium]|nr:hypothetical protein [Candidatus Taylorbacteria bacterium]
MTIQDLTFDGKNFIPTKKAVELSGYSTDYIGQLCRGGKLECKMVGRLWYVAEDSLKNHLKLIETLTALRNRNPVQLAESAPLPISQKVVPQVLSEQQPEIPAEASEKRVSKTDIEKAVVPVPEETPVHTVSIPAPAQPAVPQIVAENIPQVSAPLHPANVISAVVADEASKTNSSRIRTNDFLKATYAHASARIADKISEVLPILQSVAQGSAHLLLHATSMPGLRSVLLTALLSGGLFFGGMHLATLPATAQLLSDVRAEAEMVRADVAERVETFQTLSFATLDTLRTRVTDMAASVRETGALVAGVVYETVDTLAVYAESYGIVVREQVGLAVGRASDVARLVHGRVDMSVEEVYSGTRTLTEVVGERAGHIQQEFAGALASAGEYVIPLGERLDEGVQATLGSFKESWPSQTASLGGLFEAVRTGFRRLALGVYTGISKVTGGSDIELAVAPPAVVSQMTDSSLVKGVPPSEAGRDFSKSSASEDLGTSFSKGETGGQPPTPMYLSSGLSSSDVDARLASLQAKLSQDIASVSRATTEVRNVTEHNS